MTILIKVEGIPVEETVIASSELCNYLKNIRKDQNLSQKAFAKQIGISVKKLRNFEKSEDPDVYLLHKVITGLGGELRIDACFDGKKERLL